MGQKKKNISWKTIEVTYTVSIECQQCTQMAYTLNIQNFLLYIQFHRILVYLFVGVHWEGLI